MPPRRMLYLRETVIKAEESYDSLVTKKLGK